MKTNSPGFPCSLSHPLDVFVYAWSAEDHSSERCFEIFLFGVKKTTTVCFRIASFMPFLFVEFPWKDEVIRKLKQKSVEAIMQQLGYHRSSACARNARGADCRFCWQGKMVWTQRKPLYGGMYLKEKWYLKIHFVTEAERRRAAFRLHKHALFSNSPPLLVHQQKASPLLQLVSVYQLQVTGWMRCVRYRRIPSEERETTAEEEYTVAVDSLSVLDADSAMAKSLGVPSPRLLAFDLEVYSHVPSRLPDASCPEDVVFQISCVNEKEQKVLLCLLGKRQVRPLVPKGIEVRGFRTEEQLLLGFRDLIHEWDPVVLLGYNVLGFDIPYMIARMRDRLCFSRFCTLGKRKEKVCPIREDKWTSSAYQNQSFTYWQMDGRFMIDMMVVTKRSGVALSNYKLKTVSSYFLGDTKDPFTARDIFRSYEKGVLSDVPDAKLYGQCGKYCVQDSALVIRLFEKMQVWISMVEMSRLCHVPMTDLYVKGQQIRTFSHIYHLCYPKGMVVDDGSKEDVVDSSYTGATVFPPVPGLYDWVVPFDFASLYPTTMIAYNIDYSTLIPSTTEDKKEEKNVHRIEWEEADGSHRCFRFYKEPMGIVPLLLQTLLTERKRVKEQMKALSRDSRERIILDQRQLAYKLAANSMYGAMGVQKGYLPFLPGARSTTAMGRQSIQKAAEFVQSQYGARIVYGDSISARTPVCVRRGAHHVDILSVEEMTQDLGKPWTATGGKEWMVPEVRSTPTSSMHVWTDQGWSRIRYWVRHRRGDKKMYRVMTRKAVVEVTADHSLLTLAHHRKISVEDLLTTGATICDTALLHGPLPVIALPNATTEEEERPSSVMNRKSHRCAIHECFEKTLMNRIESVRYGWSPHGTRMWRVTWNATSSEETIHGPFEGTDGCPLKMKVIQKEWEMLQEQFSFLFHSPFLFEMVWVGEEAMKRSAAWCLWLQNRCIHYEFVKITTCSIHLCVSPSQSLSFTEPSDYVVRDIVEVEDDAEDWVYDLGTGNHHFQAGAGNMIVHNTDSIYVHFPSVADSASCLWDLAKSVENHLLTLYRKPMKLVFEEKLYKLFLIFTKKRYMALTCDQEGNEFSSLTKRGVLLNRRDNCAWIRRTYEAAVQQIMKKAPLPVIQQTVVDAVWELLTRRTRLSDLTITKSVGENYAIRPLPDDPIKRSKRMKDLGIRDETEYHHRSLPAHVQLAQKMKRRGIPIEAGSRIEYVVVTHPQDPKAKLFDKLEDPEYLFAHGDVVRIDMLYYVKQLVMPMDQLLVTVFQCSKWTEKLYQSLEHYRQCHEQLIRRPRVTFHSLTRPTRLQQYFSKSSK